LNSPEGIAGKFPHRSVFTSKPAAEAAYRLAQIEKPPSGNALKILLMKRMAAPGVERMVVRLKRR